MLFFIFKFRYGVKNFFIIFLELVVFIFIEVNCVKFVLIFIWFDKKKGENDYMNVNVFFWFFFKLYLGLV